MWKKSQKKYKRYVFGTLSALLIFVQDQLNFIFLSHPNQSSSKSNFPLCFPFFTFSLFRNFLIFFPFPFSVLEVSLVYFPLFFPFLKPILFSSSLFLISHFSFKYKGFWEFFIFTFQNFILIKSRMKPYEKRKIGVKIGKRKRAGKIFVLLALRFIFLIFTKPKPYV